MGFLKNMFTSRNSLENRDVVRPDDVAEQIESRNKKGFFERVSEKATSLVGGLRSMFKKKAMRVLDPSLQESLRSDSILVVTGNDGAIYSTRNVKRRDPSGKYGTYVDTFRRSRNGTVSQVSDTIWGEMHNRKKVSSVDPQPTAMKRTGTDSRSFQVADSVVKKFADIGVSREYSLLSLRYGIELSAVEKAYKDDGRSAEQLMFGLVNRINRRDELGVSALVGKVAGKMFNNGEVDVPVLQSFITDLESVGVSKDELKRVVRDTAAYAYLLDSNNKEIKDPVGEALNFEPANNYHNSLFDGFDDMPEIDVMPIESGLMQKLSETSFSGESEVRDRSSKSFDGIKVEPNPEPNPEVGNEGSDSEIVTLEEFSDKLEMEKDDLRATMKGEAEYYSMVESEAVQRLRRELKEAKEIAERANEKAENATRIAEEAIDQAKENSLRIDGLHIDVENATQIGLSVLGQFMQAKEDLIQPEIPEDSNPEIRSGMFGDFSLVLDDNESSSMDFEMPADPIGLGNEDTDVKFFQSFSPAEVKKVFPDNNPFKHSSGTATYAPLDDSDKN